MLLAAYDVGKEECHGSTAHGVKKVEAERRAVEKPPGLVGDKRLEVLPKRCGALSGKLFACELEAEEEEYETACSNHDHGKLPARLGATSRMCR